MKGHAEIFYPSISSIRTSQLRQLRELLSVALESNPFQQRKLSGTRLDASLPSLEEFIRRCPLTTKQEITEDQKSHPPYGTNLTYPLERYTRLHQTSGTRGSPLCWLDTPESWAWMVGSWKQIFRAAGVHGADRAFVAFSFEPFLGFWMAFEAAEELGCLCWPAGGLSSAARVRAILAHRITVLCCTPTYAIRLAEVAAQEGIDLNSSQVKTLIVAGEPGGSIPATRRRIAELWPGIRVFDHHGMTEAGPVTFECPERPGILHVMETAYLAEVVDPKTGQPAAAGASGELVLTTLGRLGSPLLRYRTGDLVKPVAAPLSSGPPCVCGRPELALEGGILGRTDDMVVIRGVNVYPSAVEGLIRDCGGIAEFQVHINTRPALAEMSVQIEPADGAGDTQALVARLEKTFQESLALRVPVTAVAKGALPRFELKAKRWVKN